MQYISSLPQDSWNTARPRNTAILGCTGSIGRSTLDVIRRQRSMFSIVALAGGRNVRLLAEQALEFRPPILGVLDHNAATLLKELLPTEYSPEILIGQSGYENIATLPEVSLVVSAQSGASGLRATVAAASSGKVIALANKESLVMAGTLIRRLCRETGSTILPVDSEHNAIFQCIQGNNASDVACLHLTASGGPFRGMSKKDLTSVSVEQALAHPNWSMGPKITIDSATLMNKGLEVIEACHLYDLPEQKVHVVVHKESIIHSLVEFADGSFLAQLGPPDMRVAIAHCIGWPHRLATGVERLDLVRLASLTFSAPDTDAFPCLRLAREAYSAGKGCTVVLNAANETAVAAFLERQIPFPGIAEAVAQALENYIASGEAAHDPDTIDAILALDEETRLRAKEYLPKA